jgi:hypothetical protein
MGETSKDSSGSPTSVSTPIKWKEGNDFLV